MRFARHDAIEATKHLRGIIGSSARTATGCMVTLIIEEMRGAGITHTACRTRQIEMNEMLKELLN